MDSHWCRYTLCIDYSHRLLPIFIVSITWQGGGGIYSGGDQWRKRHGQIQLAGRTNRVTHLIHTDKSSPLNTPYLINTPSKDILLTHLLNIPTQPTLSTHPLNPPSQTTLSTHPLNPPSQPTLSTPTVNPPSRPTLSTQPSTQL